MNVQKMDEQVIQLLDVLSSNELTLAENIAVVAKVLSILLRCEQQRAKTEEEKEIMQKARERIATYILSGE